MVIPLTLSIIWCLANIIVRLSRARPMHPGANVGCDLILWLAFIPVLVFSYVAGVVWLALDDYYSYYSSSSSRYRYRCASADFSNDDSTCDDLRAAV